MSVMALVKVVSRLALLLALLELNFSTQAHVHHRIHVPTKVKTVYRTKIIKVRVPEHHHYITEKEKPHIVKVPEHHHHFYDKEKQAGLYSENHSDWNSEYDREDDYDYERRPVYKKRAPAPGYKKKKKRY